jgi:hypothetical protein
MAFVQKRTTEANDNMRAMRVKLIDRTLALGGSYYLPYRLHATLRKTPGEDGWMRGSSPRMTLLK